MEKNSELERFRRKIATAYKTISESQRELGLLKRQRSYWIGGRKNRLATQLEKIISQAEARKNELILKIDSLQAEKEALAKEMSHWTLCPDGHIDRAGGATCPECGKETQAYIAS